MAASSKVSKSPPPPATDAVIRGWTAVLGGSSAALSLFRIVLGSLLTLELLLRFRFLRPFYTDAGTLPLDILLGRVDTVYKIVCGLHCQLGELWQQQLLLGVQVVLAILLTLGYRTRLTSIMSWYFYLALTLRNTWMNYILDRYFHYLLFLAMLLPLDGNGNGRSSTAPGQNSSRPYWYLSPATVALKALLLWIYFDAGYGKYADPDGGWSYAADPLPALDTYARHTTFAQYMYALLGPSGLRLLTPTVVYVELLAAPVALLGLYVGRPAVVYTAIATICSLHVGIALSLRNAALLSLVACAAWMPLLPPFWVKRSNATTTATPVKVKYSSARGTTVSLLLIGGMVAGSFWLETRSRACDQSVRHVWSTVFHNRWNVFVGAETYVTWEIAPGRLADGSIVDVWGRNDATGVNWNLPGGGAPCTATARPGRWRSFPYLAGLEQGTPEGEALWRYLCDEWDRDHGVHSNGNNNAHRQLLQYNFFMLQADVLPEMQFSATRKRLIVSYDCVVVAAPSSSENDTTAGMMFADAVRGTARATTAGEVRAAAADDDDDDDDDEQVRIPAGAPAESAEPEQPPAKSSEQPEVPREAEMMVPPTEEPEYKDPDRNEPVPGDEAGATTENQPATGSRREQILLSRNGGEETHEPEVPREPDVPTDEPEYMDPDRSIPVPGDDADFTQEAQRIETKKESNEPEVPMESAVPTDEPEYVDPDRSVPVPGNEGDEL